ncbi:MAG: hypothetical protein WA977_00355 [Halobacteriota archaeon]
MTPVEKPVTYGLNMERQHRMNIPRHISHNHHPDHLISGYLVLKAILLTTSERWQITVKERFTVMIRLLRQIKR